MSLLRKDKKDDRHRQATADHSNSGTRKDARPANSKSDASPQQATGTDLEVVTQLDPVRGWKSLDLKADEYTVHICSRYTGQSIRLEELFHCVRICTPRDNAFHEVPKLGCSCGFYALKNVADVQSPAMIIAEVDLYGTVIETERGYRAEYQRILALSIYRLCMQGFLCMEQADLVDFPEIENTWSRPSLPTIERKLLPTCRTHASGTHVVELGQIAARLGVEVRWQ